MKYYTHILSLILSAAFLFQACSYLDVVPDETPDEKDAFQNPTMAERYLYSCYSFLPNPRHETASLDLMTADEVVTPWEHETFANFPKGNYNASEPVISYWNTLFGGIRRCYILLENIDAVPNMTEANLRIYKGEAKFLIAYYHFLLLKNYGPIPLIKGVMSIDMDKADFPERDSYDVCVQWISDLFDEAAGMLPAEQTSTAYGRATSVAAKALKSRLWLYAASPLFNGNSEYYANFVSKVDGRHLISQTYSEAKWEKAASASGAPSEFHGLQHFERGAVGRYPERGSLWVAIQVHSLSRGSVIGQRCRRDIDDGRDVLFEKRTSDRSRSGIRLYREVPLRGVS